MNLFIKKSKIRGAGVFTKVAIKKGEFIHTFSGDRVDLKEIGRRQRSGKEAYDDPLQIGDDLYLDCDEFSRTFNHSCKPNAGVRKECDLIAIRDIKKGEEITFDYSVTVGVEKTWWQMPCNCGERQCRKVISAVVTIPPKILYFYYKNNFLPDYIKAQLEQLAEKVA